MPKLPRSSARRTGKESSPSGAGDDRVVPPEEDRLRVDRALVVGADERAVGEVADRDPRDEAVGQPGLVPVRRTQLVRETDHVQVVVPPGPLPDRDRLRAGLAADARQPARRSPRAPCPSSTGRHRPPPRSPSRLRGVISREGWYMISAAASPLGHICPRLNGEPGAGLHLHDPAVAARAAGVEQPPWQPRQTDGEDRMPPRSPPWTIRTSPAPCSFPRRSSGATRACGRVPRGRRPRWSRSRPAAGGRSGRG